MPANTGVFGEHPTAVLVHVACQQCDMSLLRKAEWSKCFACILSCRIMVPINCHFMEANWTMVQKVKEKKKDGQSCKSHCDTSPSEDFCKFILPLVLKLAMSLTKYAGIMEIVWVFCLDRIPECSNYGELANSLYFW